MPVSKKRVSKKAKKAKKKKNVVSPIICRGHICPPKDQMLEDIANNLIYTGSYRMSTFDILEKKSIKTLQEIWVDLIHCGKDVVI